MLENRQKFIDDLNVIDKIALKTATYSMTIRDRFVKVTPAAATVITLPNVVEAMGKTFTILATVANATNKVTITDGGKSRAFGRLGALELKTNNAFVVLYSDGETWCLLAASLNAVTPNSVETFRGVPFTLQNDGTATSGTDTEVNQMVTNDGNIWEYINIGTQTITAPVAGASGLDVSRDQTADDGTELTRGITAACPDAYVVGAAAFYAKLQFSIEDVSGTDDCAFGFRKVEAYQAAIDNYDEMAALNVIAGAITIETILNGNATVSTDTTNAWADGETHELEVRVALDGAVTYLIDGVAPTVTAAFSFDLTENVIPFFYFLHDTDLAGAVNLKHFECGLL